VSGVERRPSITLSGRGASIQGRERKGGHGRGKEEKDPCPKNGRTDFLMLNTPLRMRKIRKWFSKCSLNGH